MSKLRARLGRMPGSGLPTPKYQLLSSRPARFPQQRFRDPPHPHPCDCSLRTSAATWASLHFLPKCSSLLEPEVRERPSTWSAGGGHTRRGCTCHYRPLSCCGGGGFSAFVSLGAIWQNEMSHRHVVTQRRDLILALPYLLHVTLDVAFCLSGPPYPLLESGATNLTPQAWTERLRISGENPMQTPSTLEELQEGSDDSLSVQALPGFDIGGVV